MKIENYITLIINEIILCEKKIVSHIYVLCAIMQDVPKHTTLIGDGSSGLRQRSEKSQTVKRPGPLPPLFLKVREQTQVNYQCLSVNAPLLD